MQGSRRGPVSLTTCLEPWLASLTESDIDPAGRTAQLTAMQQIIQIMLHCSGAFADRAELQLCRSVMLNFMLCDASHIRFSSVTSLHDSTLSACPRLSRSTPLFLVPVHSQLPGMAAGTDTPQDDILVHSMYDVPCRHRHGRWWGRSSSSIRRGRWNS